MRMWQKKWESKTRETNNRESESLFPMCPFWMRKIECMVVEKKKHDELLSKYMGEDLMEEQAEAKAMLNI
jgi:hypothetical protein